jgi:uncharacterized PurR-regulated membrane protein YhhQ (DUF165 family)
MKYLLTALLAISVWVANILIGNVGTVCIEKGPCLIPVGFGLMAPSGVLMIGLVLVIRDYLQEYAGWKWSVGAVVLGGLISYFTSDPFVAIASMTAFIVAELFDLSVYTPLREKGKHWAVVASGVVGAGVDSLLFTYIAFGAFEFALGNFVAKIYASVAVAIYLYWRHRAALPRNTLNT